MAATSDSRELFNSLSSKITQLSYGRSKNDRSVINAILDELNSFNYKYPIVTSPTKAVLLVNQCCSLIPPEDEELVLKCCQLITNLITRQKVVIDGRTLTVAVVWCLQALKDQDWIADLLVALDALLRANTGHELITEIVKNNTLISLANNQQKPELAFFALQCLEACTIPPEDTKILTEDEFKYEFQISFEIFLKHTVTNNFNLDKLISKKIYIVCLRGLQNIIRIKPNLLSDNLGIILGVVKSYMLLGIAGIEFVKPQKLLPSPLSIPESSTNEARGKGGKMTKQRKPKTQPTIMKTRKSEKWEDDTGGYTPAVTDETMANFGNGVKTSDSDFSDTEGGNLAKLNVMNGRVRQAALGLFLHSIKLTHKTVIFSYWSSFIPENPLSSKHNLMTCILKETSNRGSMGALNALLVLLSLSKVYLAQAEKGENLAFTPFSVVLGLTIKELHKCLSLALSAHSIPVLTMVLKCFAALVQATPYHRLAPGLITKVIRNVKPFIYHKDSTVQVAALIVLGCVLASEPIIPECREAFLKSTKNSECSDSDTPWLLHRCLVNLGVDTDQNSVPTPVKLESLQIISIISRNYFEDLVAPYLNHVTRALDLSLASKYTDVQLHAGRAVDFIGQAMNRCSAMILPEEYLLFWQTLLKGSLTALFQCEQPVLRAIGCDCLGSIGAETFEQLPRDKQILCVTLLFASSRDEENTVKGAAVRALAISVLYPSLREDSGFVVDTAERIYSVLGDENFAVRVKCSWALGNLSDALVLNKTSAHLMEEFPKNLILKLLKETIKASNDGDKIKMNTVRALGNLLQLIDENLIEEGQFRDAVQEGIDILVKNCTSGSNMKVRWNSCYAIGNAMKNSSIFSLENNWQEKIFHSLSDLVVNFRNFKVRINAALALSSPHKREFYGQFYQPVWISLMKGLETSENVADFNEYKHRDNLVEQICLTLGHLMTLLTKEDLTYIKDSVNSGYLKIQMKRVWEKLLPEKSTVLYDAQTYVTNLKSNAELNTEQKNILDSLNNILIQDF
ncbi:HEAT repeat-containing protein 6 [Tribolium madens]|uniref:HEAT repeat-containing protein 6 n=1 Tax=Tribolium madens TaxID=41895 RepID=UPI001CF7407E|nr:HEAT repeat-containing protein 6 [Tribolium madens]